jgi:hypothetical protein
LILSVAEERESQRERERGRGIIKVKKCCSLMAEKTNRNSED